jgi:hypothetical protein
MRKIILVLGVFLVGVSSQANDIKLDKYGDFLVNSRGKKFSNPKKAHSYFAKRTQLNKKCLIYSGQDGSCLTNSNKDLDTAEFLLKTMIFNEVEFKKLSPNYKKRPAKNLKAKKVKPEKKGFYLVDYNGKIFSDYKKLEYYIYYMRLNSSSCIVFDGHDGACIDVDGSEKGKKLYNRLSGPLILKHNAEISGTRRSDDPLKVNPRKDNSLLVDHNGYPLSFNMLNEYISERFEDGYVCLIYNGSTGECMTYYHKVEGDKLIELQWVKEQNSKKIKEHKNENLQGSRAYCLVARCWESYEAYEQQQIQERNDHEKAHKEIEERIQKEKLERLLRKFEEEIIKNENKHRYQ